MTESEWLTSDDPAAMLRFLGSDKWIAEPPHLDRQTGRVALLVTDRKLRLFACACARLMGYVHTEAALCNAEIWAETGEEQYEPEAASRLEGFHWCYFGAMEAASRWASARSIVPTATRATLLRCIFSPFRSVTYPCPVCKGSGSKRVGSNLSGPIYWQCRSCRGRRSIPGINPKHLTTTVLTVARGIYERRAWGETGVLADALTEAGCDDEDILRHLTGWQRCPACLGAGKRHPMNDQKYALWNCSAFNDGCDNSGWVRPRCSACGGRGEFSGGAPLKPPEQQPIRIRCPTCNGTKVAPVVFCRGDWVLDLILGKE